LREFQAFNENKFKEFLKNVDGKNYELEKTKEKYIKICRVISNYENYIGLDFLTVISKLYKW
jgi:capsid portal protein